MTQKVRKPNVNELRLVEAMVRAGIYTVNEVRAQLDLPPVPSGEELAR